MTRQSASLNLSMDSVKHKATLDAADDLMFACQRVATEARRRRPVPPVHDPSADPTLLDVLRDYAVSLGGSSAWHPPGLLTALPNHFALGHFPELSEHSLIDGGVPVRIRIDELRAEVAPDLARCRFLIQRRARTCSSIHAATSFVVAISAA
jgi:hypothetical protein